MKRLITILLIAISATCFGQRVQQFGQHGLRKYIPLLQVDSIQVAHLDSVGTATGGCVFRDAATGLFKIGPCGSGSGGTLNAVNVGTGQTQLFVLGTDTLAGKTIKADNGLTLTTDTDSTNHIKLGGTLNPTSTLISGSGAGTSFQMGTGVDIVSILFAPQNFQVSSAIAFGNWDNITTGTTHTIPGTGASNVLFNPASVIASFTLTMPASPIDGHIIEIHAGGTISGNSPVVTALTVSPNSGQSIMEKAAITTLVGGDCYIYKYKSSSSIWYRVQ